MNSKKYRFESGRIINRHTDTVIPEDEPVFVLRAADVHALKLVGQYALQCTNPEHRAEVMELQREFNAFTKEHESAMREPD